MARSDIYLDAMLRHLGAAYYESLHGTDVQWVLDEIPLPDAADLTALVRNGVVTLTGTVDHGAERHDLIRLAVRLIWDVDGVVDVVNRIGEALAAAKEPEQAS
ncbi:MAG: BON domain-containing protein [Streptosporangiaceae bacterium]